MAIPHKKNNQAVLEKAVSAWMILHVKLVATVRPLEAKLDVTKALVVKLMKSAGLEVFDSKQGRIPLMTKTVIDWEGVARSVGTSEQIEAALPNFTHQSEAFVRAPQSWSGKAK